VLVLDGLGAGPLSVATTTDLFASSSWDGVLVHDLRAGGVSEDILEEGLAVGGAVAYDIETRGGGAEALVGRDSLNLASLGAFGILASSLLDRLVLSVNRNNDNKGTDDGDDLHL